MPKSRHSHRIARLTGLTVAVLVLVGCYQQPEPPRQFVPGNELHDQFTTRGDRMVIRTAGDDPHPLMKLRQRTRHTRVYDDRMVPTGRVEIDGEVVEARSLDGLTRRSVHWDKDDRFAELDDGWALHAAGDDRWQLSDSNGDPVATIEHVDDRWTVDPAADGKPHFVDTDHDTHRVVSSEDDSTLLEAPVADWSPLKLMAMMFEPIEPLERYALAVWMDHHLEG